MRLFTAAITGLIAVGAAYGAVTGGGLGSGLLAAFMGAVSLMMLRTRPATGDRWSGAELAGRPAWRLSLGPAQRVPAVALVLTVLGLTLVWGAVAVLGGAAGGSVAVAVLAGLLAAFLLVLAAQLWQTWRRPPTLLVSAEHLRYDGTGVEVDLAWDDVATIEHADRTSRWACLKVLARADAPSYAVRRRRTLLPVDRVPDPAGLELRHGLVADLPALTALLRELQVGGRPAREAMLAGGPPEA